MNEAISLANRAARRKNTDPSVLYERIERRLHTMHLSARKASLLANLPADGIRTIARGRIPRADKLKALAEVLGVDLNWFDLDPESDAVDRAVEANQPERDLPKAPVNRGLTTEGAVLDAKFTGLWEDEIERITDWTPGRRGAGISPQPRRS